MELDTFRKRVGQGRVSIESIVRMFKNSQYPKVLRFLQHRVFLQAKIPALIEVLGDIKTSEKYALHEIAESFVY